MKDSTIIGDSVDRSNIKYILGVKITQAEFCTRLADDYSNCRTLLECGQIKEAVRENITKPPYC